MPGARGALETTEAGTWQAQLHLANRMMLDALGLVGQAALSLDATGAVIDANSVAQAMLDDGRLVIGHGYLTCAGPDGAVDLARMVARCLAHPDEAGARMQIASPGGPLSLQCAPFPAGMAHPPSQQPAAVVMIADPRHRLRQRLVDLTRRYGLTRAEADLAMAVMETGSRKAAARARGVSDTTARSQLTSIFDKTGVRRQTELVRLLLDPA